MITFFKLGQVLGEPNEPAGWPRGSWARVHRGFWTPAKDASVFNLVPPGQRLRDR